MKRITNSAAILILSIFILFSRVSFAQVEGISIVSAENYFLDKDYRNALIGFEDYLQGIQFNRDVSYKAGICATRLGIGKKAIYHITNAKSAGKTYNLSKRWLDYQKYLQNESPTLKGTAKLFPLIDKFMLEGLENFYDKYPSSNNSVDSDTNRLYWALQKDDHGKLLELLLTRNQLIEDERNINRAELDRELAKRKQDLEILEGRYKRDLQIEHRRKEGEKGEGASDQAKTEGQCLERPSHRQTRPCFPSRRLPCL
jgi:hypothetical protein